MLNKDYLWPGFAAIALAIIFPIYWIYVFTAAGFDFPEGYYENVLSFDISDWVYLFIGALEIYIYLSFKRILHDRLNFHGVDILLVLMIYNTILFHFSLFGIDAYLFFGGEQTQENVQETLLKISWFVSIGCTIIYGLIGVLLGIMLLRHYNHLPEMLKIFAILTLVLNLFQLTFVFGFVVILLFPISLLILAVYFLQEPTMIEVV
ncbi:MAG: hypothetical protein ABW044_07665 [Cellvibrio sp.]